MVGQQKTTQDCIFNPTQKPPAFDGVKTVIYKPHHVANEKAYGLARRWENATGSGFGAAQATKKLRHEGFMPDIIIGHVGWGELTFSKEIYPDVHIIGFFEYFYSTNDGPVGFDPESPVSEHAPYLMAAHNAVPLVNIEVVDLGHCPTYWQRDRFPKSFHDRVYVCHDSIQLLGGNIETTRRDRLFEYEIPAWLRKVIKNSTVFARLQREVMFALSSKYALTLYEMVQKRGNLRWRSSEKFLLADIHRILGVPKGKLTSWSNMKLCAIDPALKEVNALSDYVVEIDPIKTGRRVTHVELRWWKKKGAGAAERELTFSKTGHKARIYGQVQPVAARPAWLDTKGVALRTETYETARMHHAWYDIYFVEGE